MRMRCLYACVCGTCLLLAFALISCTAGLLPTVSIAHPLFARKGKLKIHSQSNPLEKTVPEFPYFGNMRTEIYVSSRMTRHWIQWCGQWRYLLTSCWKLRGARLDSCIPRVCETLCSIPKPTTMMFEMDQTSPALCGPVSYIACQKYTP
jgi:hypothetical protein